MTIKHLPAGPHISLLIAVLICLMLPSCSRSQTATSNVDVEVFLAFDDGQNQRLGDVTVRAVPYSQAQDAIRQTLMQQLNAFAGSYKQLQAYASIPWAVGANGDIGGPGSYLAAYRLTAKTGDPKPMEQMQEMNKIRSRLYKIVDSGPSKYYESLPETEHETITDANGECSFDLDSSQDWVISGRTKYDQYDLIWIVKLPSGTNKLVLSNHNTLGKLDISEAPLGLHAVSDQSSAQTSGTQP